MPVLVFTQQMKGDIGGMGNWGQGIGRLGTGDWENGRLGGRYAKVGEVELEEGEHVTAVHSPQSTVHSQKDEEIKLVLVNKEERERVEKEIWERINQPEAEVCYIFGKEGAQFYIP